MAFYIEKSTKPAAVGAGAPPPKFTDYTHKLKFEDPETGDTAEALATFGDGPELHGIRLWAERAHGFDLLSAETFDAKAEHKARKEEAAALAADLADAKNEADRIVAHARQEAEKILRAARTEADDIVAEATKVRQAAETEAAELVESAELMSGFGAEEEDALAELQEGDQAGADDARKMHDDGETGDQAGEVEAEGDQAGEDTGKGPKGGKGRSNR